MTTYLFIWMVIAGAGDHYEKAWRTGWVNSGSFESGYACKSAAASLGLKENEFRCIGRDGK